MIKNHISDLITFLKLQNKEPLTLSDVLELIPYKYEWFKTTVISRKNSKLDVFYDRLIGPMVSSGNTNLFLDINNINELIPVFDLIFISDLGTLSKEEQKVYSNHVQRIQAFNVANFKEIREYLYKTRDDFSSSIGINDPTYNETYHRTEQKQTRPFNPNDVFVLQGFSDLIDTCDYIIANKTTFNTSFDPFAVVRNAIEDSLPIKTSKTGFLVRFKRYDTLSSLAGKYLGNQDRWGEIAIANGLQPPYIDLDGEDLPPISNGHTNKITISSRFSERFEVGSYVYLFSKYFLPEQHKIIDLKTVSESSILILTLSGDQDLERFRIEDGFGVKVFKPNTVNEYFDIMIPSDSSDVTLESLSEYLEAAPSIVKNAGTDLRLSNTGDLSLTESEDLNLINGYDNLVQAVQLILSSEKGGLQKHTDYGVPNHVGSKFVSALDQKKQVAEGIVKAIEKDPRFTKVSEVVVKEISEAQRDPNAPKGFELSMSIYVAGVTTPIPIQFRL